jgi:hypothetical protein
VFNTNVPFNTTGTVRLEAGILQFVANANLSGEVQQAGGSMLFQGATYTLAAGVQIATVVLDGGTVVSPANLTLVNLTIMGDGRVTLQNSAVLTVTGVLNWDRGMLTNGGKLSLAAGAVANLTSGNFKFIDGIFENAGTVNYTGTSLRFSRDAQNLAARIENLAGGRSSWMETGTLSSTTTA